MKFMSSKAKGTDFPFFEIEWFFSCALNGVGMEKDSVFCTNGSDFSHGLAYTGFVVCAHDGDQNRVGTNCLREIVWINKTIGTYVEVGNGKVFRFFESLKGV